MFLREQSGDSHRTLTLTATHSHRILTYHIPRRLACRLSYVHFLTAFSSHYSAAATSLWYMTQQREQHQYEVDTRVRRHEVRVEFCHVGVECAVEAERCRERRRPGRRNARRRARHCSAPPNDTDTDNGRTALACHRARAVRRTVDLGSKDLVEEVSSPSKRANDAKSAMSFYFVVSTTPKKREREEKIGCFLALLIRNSPTLAVGLLFGNNGTRARSHGTWKATWFPGFLVCEFERGMKS